MLAGPPGVGKTLFAEAFAGSALGEDKDSKSGIPLIACSYYAWQSEGHLGDFLAAMRRDFSLARAQAPSVVLLEECDSFIDRRVKHSNSEYGRNCVNALLEEVDGVRRREGVFLIGCTNAVEVCDPALLRSGRFEKVVRVGLPEPAELEKIFRVRLGDDLRGANLFEIVELAAGMTGADVERVVKDGRRAARRDGRALALEDLRYALVGGDEGSDELRWRTAIHEAGHVTVDVLRFGAEGVVANTTPTNRRLGMSMRTTGPAFAGTAREYRSWIEVLLAGRAAEEALLGDTSHGAQDDIAQATELTCAMLGSLGLAGPSPLTHLGEAGRAREFLRFTDVRVAAGIELAEVDRSCRELLEANRVALIAVARRLFQARRIDGAEVERLLQAARSSTADGECARLGSEAPSDRGGTVIAFPNVGPE
jgi:ATP-dependent Zn protease